MGTDREQLTEARELIKQKRHDEARALLRTINHPKAREWLEQLDAMYPSAQKPAARNTSTKGQPPADPFASPPQQTPARPKPADTGNVGITTMTVFLGGIIAVAVTLPLTLLADNFLDIHAFFMSDPRRVTTFMGGFAAIVTFALAFIARLIGGKHHILIGVYYVLLAFGVLFGWHYGSFYLQWGADYGLQSPLTSEAFEAYSHFLSTIPTGLYISYGLAGLVTLSFAFFLGATSDEELRRRAREGRR